MENITISGQGDTMKVETSHGEFSVPMDAQYPVSTECGTILVPMTDYIDEIRGIKR